MSRPDVLSYEINYCSRDNNEQKHFYNNGDIDKNCQIQKDTED